MVPMPVALPYWKSSNRYVRAPCPRGGRGIAPGTGISSCSPAIGAMTVLSPLQTSPFWPGASMLPGSCSGAAAVADLSSWSILCSPRKSVPSCTVHTCAWSAASSERVGTCSAWPEGRGALNSHSFLLFQLIRDYSTPPNEELSRDLVAKLKPHIR